MISDSSNIICVPTERQRTAALSRSRGTGAFFRKPLFPQGFGVRLSSAAFLSAVFFAISPPILAANPSSQSPDQNNSFPVLIQIDASRPKDELHPIWRFFGADEPNYATMKNGKKLIGELGALSPKNVFFRAHNLLTSGDGTPALKWGSTGVYDEGADGKPVYSWTILDGIFDTYLKRGVKPYVEIGFMPKA